MVSTVSTSLDSTLASSGDNYSSITADSDSSGDGIGGVLYVSDGKAKISFNKVIS